MNIDKKTTSNPYLIFYGNCEEAMTFYKDALQGELELIAYKNSPIEIPQEFKDKILHSALKFGDTVIMATDSMMGPKIFNYNNVHIYISSKNPEEAERFFNNLAVDGKITMPFKDTFWNAKFGALADKFGVNWMIQCEQEYNHENQ
ncbi:MAG TPA: VOC family protein [Victivallales bacterium]|nr:VOC family protein [Victivallales bacterium]